jgi:hypothetical protein
MTATAFIDPVVGVTLSAVVVIIAYLVAGWAFRLTVFGTVFTWDFLTGKRHRFRPDTQGNKVFLARAVDGAPLRTWGRVARDATGRLQFAYRPWLVLPGRTVELPAAGLAVGRGAFWPTVECRGSDGEGCTLLTLPPRYKGHEPEFAAACGITELRDVGLRRGWAVLKEMLGLGARQAAPAAT